MNTHVISNMTREEKLQAMEALWDSLAHEADPPPSPDWHRDVLEARRAKIKAGTATFVSLDEVKADQAE